MLSGGMHRELSRADLSVNRQHRAAGRKHRADSLMLLWAVETYRPKDN